MVNVWIEFIIKIVMFFLCIALKRFLVRAMYNKHADSTIVEMWMNGAIIVVFILILLNVYRILF